jgi:hypothetical protein
MSHIVDDIEAVVSGMRGGTFDSSFDRYSRGDFPYFMFGHLAEINQRLVLKDRGKNSKFEKYPLIALRSDIIEQNSGGLSSYNLNVAIFTKTSDGLNAEERLEQVFKPVLIPLYDLFIEQLRKSGLFVWVGHPIPEHTYVERPFWGTQNEQQNLKRILNDPVDCIELIDLKLKKRNC